MKIELIQKEDWDGTWYHIQVNGLIRYSFTSKDRAVDSYEKMVERARKPAVATVLLSEEVPDTK